ncbi:hypothetical protein M493_05112 [Geobacillus genomosp. 3]|uniref:Uncharacterized protein n=1 Tax=Geobacillus genomosp. 3 TaxID=1921421 RepID=V5LVQ7_GEOG3|nr:hypothetical protein M493_05112 [Geobacillus genomosp. 3]
MRLMLAPVRAAAAWQAGEPLCQARPLWNMKKDRVEAVLLAVYRYGPYGAGKPGTYGATPP